MNGKQLSILDQDDSFFERKRSWSTSKHRLLLRYLQAFCYVLGSVSQRLNYVDGFSGEGKYEEGIGLESFVDKSPFWKSYNHKFSDTDGSPLIALRCSNIFHDEDRVRLNCFFVEANRDANIKLQENCESVSQNKFYRVYEPNKFGDLLTEILGDLEGLPTLFFLDSFGIKGITFEQIKTIADYLRNAKGELFLLFHNTTVARSAGQSTSTTDNPSSIKAGLTITKHLTNFLGQGSEEVWKSKWAELKSQPQEFERWALQYFKSRLIDEGCFQSVTSFAVKETYKQTRPEYSIVACSNKPDKAFGELLNDFIYHEKRLLFFKDSHQHQGITKFLENEWEREKAEQLKKLDNELPTLLASVGQSWQSVDKFITKIILNRDEIGLLSRSHYREAILELYRNGQLEARNLGKKGGVTLQSEIKLRH
jgi:three-Cys-motif partner protein